MGSILIYGALTVLAFVCVLVVLFVLMQKPSANAGMGSALGGATSESVFGGEAAGVLSKATVIFISAFFILCAALYLAFLGARDKGEGEGLKLEEKAEPAQPVPAVEEAPAAAIVPADAEPVAEPAAQPAPASQEGVPAQQDAQPVGDVPAQQ